MLTVFPLSGLPGFPGLPPVDVDAGGDAAAGGFAPLIARLLGPEMKVDCLSLPPGGEILPAGVAMPAALPADEQHTSPPIPTISGAVPVLPDRAAPVSPAPPSRFAPTAVIAAPTASPALAADQLPPMPAVAEPAKDARPPFGATRTVLLTSAATALPAMRLAAATTPPAVDPPSGPTAGPTPVQLSATPLVSARRPAVASPESGDAEDMSALPAAAVDALPETVIVLADTGITPDVAGSVQAPGAAPPPTGAALAPDKAPGSVAVTRSAARPPVGPMERRPVDDRPAGTNPTPDVAFYPTAPSAAIEAAPTARVRTAEALPAHAGQSADAAPPAPAAPVAPIVVAATAQLDVGTASPPRTRSIETADAEPLVVLAPPTSRRDPFAGAAPVRAEVAPRAPWHGVRPDQRIAPTPVALAPKTVEAPPVTDAPLRTTRPIVRATTDDKEDPLAPLTQRTMPPIGIRTVATAAPAAVPVAARPIVPASTPIIADMANAITPLPIDERRVVSPPVFAEPEAKATADGAPMPTGVMTSRDRPGPESRATTPTTERGGTAPTGIAPASAAPVILPALQAFGAAIRRAMADERKSAPSSGDAGLGLAALASTAAPAAAPPVAASDTTLDTADHRWPQAMAEQIEKLRDAIDSQSTRIRLLPDALGPVDVTVRRDGEQVHVHFTAAEAQTRQLLADAQPRLADAAEARGLKLGRTDVSGGDLTGSDRQQQQRAPAQPSQPPRPAPARMRAPVADEADSRLA